MKKFDAAIAGCGVIGGAIALELARAGLRVAVFDRQQPGQEASWAGAGILSPAPENPGMVAMVPLRKASLIRDTEPGSPIPEWWRWCRWERRAWLCIPNLSGWSSRFPAKARAFDRRGRSRHCFL